MRKWRSTSAPTMPAIDRYTGVLYDALDVGSLRGATATRARARLAVGSALFGLLRADDLEETKAFWRAALTALASLVS